MALTLHAVFRFAYRQAEGLLGFVISLLSLSLRVPDHTTLRATPFRVSVLFPTWMNEQGIGWERTGLVCGFGAVQAARAGERDGSPGAGARAASGLGKGSS